MYYLRYNNPSSERCAGLRIGPRPETECPPANKLSGSPMLYKNQGRYISDYRPSRKLDEVFDSTVHDRKLSLLVVLGKNNRLIHVFGPAFCKT